MCTHTHTHSSELAILTHGSSVWVPVVSEETEPTSIKDSSLCLIIPVRRTWGVTLEGRQVQSSHLPEAQGEAPLGGECGHLTPHVPPISLRLGTSPRQLRD